MRVLRLASLSFALAAALLALAATPGIRQQQSLHADDLICNGIGKDCQLFHVCTQLCGTTCCSWTDTHTYYPAES